jgi:hypothetical protein
MKPPTAAPIFYVLAQVSDTRRDALWLVVQLVVLERVIHLRQVYSGNAAPGLVLVVLLVIVSAGAKVLTP